MSGYYLDIPPDYCEPLGKLRWSALADAIEGDDGRTFALTPQLLAFLEGFASRRPLVHFGHVLHFFHLLRVRKTARHDFTTLAMAWHEAGRPSRTAGVVCALLCAEVPVVVDPPETEALAGWLNVWARVSVRPVMPGVEPILDGDTFEGLLGVELEAYSFRELVHWFRHGREPLDSEGEALADGLLADKPLSLSEILARVGRHDRLSGAVPFVATLVGAIALPPRRHVEPQVAIGGFADVTTKGRPEAILPSQFALDEWEFLRRFAQNELLYYRREDPAIRTRERLVVLLDQGVRTWGGVRLLLAAATFALAKMAERRQLSLALATTGTGGVTCDPLTTDPAELAGSLARSDLSATPAEALATVAEEPAEGPRDVVLLTHPRNLAEPDVIAACARVAKSSRLFALTADAGGGIELSEVRPGGVVALSRFRVDLSAKEPTPAPAVSVSGWAGDVEVIGHPFRCGLAGYHEPLSFAFERAGESLLVASSTGALLLMRTDGGAVEMLPRPLYEGRLLDCYTGVIGVERGFVVTAVVPTTGGRMAAVAAHYDLAARACRVHEFEVEVRSDLRWRYFCAEHAIGVMSWEAGRWVHLGESGGEKTLPDRLRWPKDVDATREMLTLPAQEVVDDSGKRYTPPVLRLNRSNGKLFLYGAAPDWASFALVEDGVPLLQGNSLLAAEVRAYTLAVLFDSKLLHLFEGPEGRWLGSITLLNGRERFALSNDGRLLAVQDVNGQVRVLSTAPGWRVHCTTPLGRFHNNLVVDLGHTKLRVIIGQTTHLIDWCEGGLVCTVGRTPDIQEIQQELEIGIYHRATPQGPRPKALDATRFRACAKRIKLAAAVTNLGEVFVFADDTLIAAFFVFRQQIAAWMPDGTRTGTEALGGPVTPYADRLIGQALLKATNGGPT